VAAVPREAKHHQDQVTPALPIKIRLYESLVLAILPYCAETWPITEANRKRLEGFHHKCLRRILNISWKDEVKNESVRKKDRSVIARMYTPKKKA